MGIYSRLSFGNAYLGLHSGARSALNYTLDLLSNAGTLATVTGINHAVRPHRNQSGVSTLMFRSKNSQRLLTFVILILLGGIVTASVALQTVNVQEIDIEGGELTVDEEAYYEYVAPRLELLVVEVEATREMVETKSRDILALTRAGTVIETLTGEIRTYGEENGVPAKFADVHVEILEASRTVNFTFEEARTALRTFNFSGMSDLVVGFGDAADAFTSSRNELNALVPEAPELQG